MGPKSDAQSIVPPPPSLVKEAPEVVILPSSEVVKAVINVEAKESSLKNIEAKESVQNIALAATPLVALNLSIAAKPLDTALKSLGRASPESKDYGYDDDFEAGHTDDDIVFSDDGLSFGSKSSNDGY